MTESQAGLRSIVAPNRSIKPRSADSLRDEAWGWLESEPGSRIVVLIHEDGSLAGALAYGPGADSQTWLFRAIGVRHDLHGDSLHFGTTLFQQCIADLIKETKRGYAFWRVHPDNLAARKMSRGNRPIRR